MIFFLIFILLLSLLFNIYWLDISEDLFFLIFFFLFFFLLYNMSKKTLFYFIFFKLKNYYFSLKGLLKISYNLQASNKSLILKLKYSIEKMNKSLLNSIINLFIFIYLKILFINKIFKYIKFENSLITELLVLNFVYYNLNLNI